MTSRKVQIFSYFSIINEIFASAICYSWFNVGILLNKLLKQIDKRKFLRKKYHNLLTRGFVNTYKSDYALYKCHEIEIWNTWQLIIANYYMVINPGGVYFSSYEGFSSSLNSYHFIARIIKHLLSNHCQISGKPRLQKHGRVLCPYFVESDFALTIKFLLTMVNAKGFNFSSELWFFGEMDWIPICNWWVTSCLHCINQYIT